MRIVDTGHRFGMATAEIFPKAEVAFPLSLREVLRAFSTKPDLVLFGGGQDICPVVYGHSNVASNVHHETIVGRDLYEMTVFNWCQEEHIPMLGICRGAQFLCAMAGGKLVQDIRGHGGDHEIVTSDGKKFKTTSTHHQMMYAKAVTHELLAWTPKALSDRYSWGGPSALDIGFAAKEPEIIYFPKINALCVQGHPECMDVDAPVVQYIRGLVQTKLGV